MTRHFIFLSLICMSSTAASALTISNLDEKPHRVVQETVPGSKVVRTIQPGETIHSIQHGGEVYVEGSPHRIRINLEDTLVIWKEGNIQIQKRRKDKAAGL